MDEICQANVSEFQNRIRFYLKDILFSIEIEIEHKMLRNHCWKQEKVFLKWDTKFQMFPQITA